MTPRYILEYFYKFRPFRPIMKLILDWSLKVGNRLLVFATSQLNYLSLRFELALSFLWDWEMLTIRSTLNYLWNDKLKWWKMILSREFVTLILYISTLKLIVEWVVSTLKHRSFLRHLRQKKKIIIETLSLLIEKNQHSCKELFPSDSTMHHNELGCIMHLFFYFNKSINK